MRHLGMIIGLLGMALCVSAAEPGEQWMVTQHMELNGMTMDMPESPLCLPTKGKKDYQKMVPMKDKDCKFSKYDAKKGHVHFHVECGQPHPSSGDVSYEMHGDNAYSGDIRSKGEMNGEVAEMHISFEGRKTGESCTVQTPQEQMQHIQPMQNKYSGMICAPALQQMEPSLFASPDAPCAAQKEEFCAHVKSYLGDLSDANHLRNISHERPDWQQLALTCGVDVSSVNQQACVKAKAGGDWATVADVCGDEAKMLAGQHCSGATEEQVLASEYAPLCHRFPQAVKVDASAKSATSSGGVMDTGKKVLDGFNSLRGLFGH